MTAAIETKAQRKMTSAFIATKPTTITLTPRVKTKSNAGGIKYANGTPRPPQIVRLNEPANSGAEPETRASDGEVDVIEFLMIAEWDAIFAEDDIFSSDGLEYEIARVLPFNGYERRALVIRRER